MLRPFLFVGLGGSGGKTLRVVRHELLRELEAVGYDRGFPAGWQFLYIDVRSEQEDSEPTLPPPLPEDAYLGLTERGQTYADIDTLLVQGDADRYREVASWRPDADSADRDIRIIAGAGQYRAVGRAVTAVGLPKLTGRLKSVKARLGQPAVFDQLAEASRLLGDRGADAAAKSEPIVIVVSSLAGGSGAGALVDVCDALRCVDASWGESFAVLYTPDVFDELDRAERSGVQPNTLAATSEILSAFWDDTPHAADQAGRARGPSRFALLERAIDVGEVRRSGPRYPLLVGRGDAELSFTTQADVYRAVGRSLAAWVTSRQVQDRLWEMNSRQAATGTTTRDTTGLAPDGQRPFSSFGHASLSLGRRDRFAEYAAGRLAGTAVDLLLRGHLDVLNRKPDDGEDLRAARLDRAVENHLEAFLEDCRLKEDVEQQPGGQHDGSRHDIGDALRDGERDTPQRHTPRERRFEEIERSILKQLTAGRPELESDRLVALVEGRVGQVEAQVLAAERRHVDEQAQRWVVRVQERIADVTATLVGRTGLPVARGVLERSARSLADLRGPLVAGATADREEAQRIPHELRRRRQQLQSARVPSSHPVVAAMVEDAVAGLWHRAEAELQDLAADLAAEVAAEVLQPLGEALRRAYERLSAEAQGSPGHPSPVEAWRRREVPGLLWPYENEFLLEPVAGFPDALDDVLRRTCGTPSEGTALLQAAGEVATRTGGGARQQLIRIHQAWSPSPRVLRTAGMPRPAELTVTARVDDLLQGAKDWVRRPQSPIGDHIHESLHDYLHADRTEEHEHRRRLNGFQTAFAQMAARSSPFAAVDIGVLSRVHGLPSPETKRITTEIPFGQGHPAREVVARVLHERDYMDPEAIERLFSVSARQGIEMTAFLGTYHPMVFESMTRTLRDDLQQWRQLNGGQEFWKWRRARPLPEFVPLPPRQRRAMVRGWFVARALGQVDIPRGECGPVQVWVPGVGWTECPYPVLGRPIRRPDEALAALLESLPLALVDIAGNRSDVLRPYERLAHLGGTVDESGGTVDELILPGEIVTWLEDGELPASAPRPDLKHSAADPQWQDRFTAMEQNLKEHQRHYDELFAQAEAALRDHRPTPRAWDLRNDIQHALRLLIAVCAERRSAEGGHAG